MNSEEQQEKVKTAVIGDSMLNDVNEKGLSKLRKVKVKNYPGATSEDILDKIDDLLKVKPDCLLVYVGTNDLTNNVNLQNSVEKWPKKWGILLQMLILSFQVSKRKRHKEYLEECWWDKSKIEKLL